MIDANNAQADGGGVHGDARAVLAFSSTPSNAGAFGTPEGGHGACGTIGAGISLQNNLAGYDAGGTKVSSIRDGGGVYLANATLLGENAAIAGNIAADAGGGIAAFLGALVSIERVTVTDNTATAGNGGGLLASDVGTDVDLLHTTFAGNAAPLGGGGGVAIVAATGTLASSTLTTNTAFVGGGLGLNLAGTATATATDVTFNDALTGGGIYAGAASSLLMLTGSISSNTGDLGGGVTADAASVTLGDTPADGCPAGGRCVTVADNVASGLFGRGGAFLLMSPNAVVQVRRSAVVHNAADQGCAFWMDRTDQTLYIHNTSVVDNHGNTGRVAAITAGAGTLGMLNDTVAHNDTGVFLTTSTAATINNSLIVQNTTDVGGLGGGLTITGSCNGVQSAAALAAFVRATNVTTVPMFASVSASAVTPGRPINTRDIVNQCTTNFLTVDLLGLLRPVQLGDRGAYEQQ